MCYDCYQLILCAVIIPHVYWGLQHIRRSIAELQSHVQGGLQNGEAENHSAEH